MATPVGGRAGEAGEQTKAAKEERSRDEAGRSQERGRAQAGDEAGDEAGGGGQEGGEGGQREEK